MILNLALLAIGITGAYCQSTHTVQVGPSGSLVYDPPSVSAAIGDTVRYCFNPKNHSVSQAQFNTPCTPLDGGFDSGLTPVAPGTPEDCSHFFDVQVNVSTPTWIYCKQPVGQHCENGMVGAINDPPTGNTLAAFEAKARALLNATTTTAASATTTPPPAGNNATAPTSAPPTAHTILVGPNDQNVYQSNNITAKVNDTITFYFVAKNHTSTRSSFADPCRALPDSQGGFDSGFMLVNPSDPTPKTFTITVGDDKPMWGYCRQTGHCGQGMVWCINAPATGNTCEAFINNALAVGNSTNSNSTSPSAGAPSPNSSNSTGSGGSNTDTSAALSSKSVSWSMIGLFAATMALF